MKHVQEQNDSKHCINLSAQAQSYWNEHTGHEQKWNVRKQNNSKHCINLCVQAQS